VGMAPVVRKLITCPVACTPASVRPAPITVVADPVMRRSFSSSASWTVGRTRSCRLAVAVPLGGVGRYPR
jgi:hypothetical protein